jgi:hypothetical protein
LEQNKIIEGLALCQIGLATKGKEKIFTFSLFLFLTSKVYRQ